MLKVFQICRPDVYLPDGRQLAGVLLDSCFVKVNTSVDRYLASSSNLFYLTSDAWSNVKNKPIINYMAVSQTRSLLVEAVNTVEQRHDASWIART
jgi:hypothetical protein